MTGLVLPALRSDDTLGFLAALGVVELYASNLGVDVRLGWDGVGGAALLHGPHHTTDGVAAALASVVETMVASGRVLPCADAGPVRPADRAARSAAAEEERGKLDPAHLLEAQAVEVYARARAAEVSGDDDSARWIAALVNQLTDAPSTGHRALTPFYAPSGQMTLHQLYSEHLHKVHRRPQLLHEALTGWVRTDGETGANLDGRALRDAVAGAAGIAVNAAVVGATWLALMAVPMFPQVSGPKARAVGWEAPRRSKPALRWPVWTQPLDRASVSVLLGHPALDELGPAPGNRSLEALGVVAVCRSSRKELRNSAGALQPPRVTPVP